jgi:hypothetical protein
MEATNVDVLGPVDYLVVEFPADKANFSGEMAAELTALVEGQLVRVLDLVLLRKEPDGSVETAELADVDETDVGELRALEADLAMLLAEEDIEEVGKALQPGSLAAVLMYENSWAGAFASSIRRAGGQLVANGRIPTQALLAAIQAAEQHDETGA